VPLTPDEYDLAVELMPRLNWYRSPKTRLAESLGREVWPTPKGCSYCTRKATRRVLAVNPITLQRCYENLCTRDTCCDRLREWENIGAARRRRTQIEWAKQHPDKVEELVSEHVLPQYPALSRRVLRAFVESGEDMATVVAASSVTALNSSIRSLGFADKVYAELRSGVPTLRRMEEYSNAHQS
jgi:hypothetical protein